MRRKQQVRHIVQPKSKSRAEQLKFLAELRGEVRQQQPVKTLNVKKFLLISAVVVALLPRLRLLLRRKQRQRYPLRRPLLLLKRQRLNKYNNYLLNINPWIITDPGIFFRVRKKLCLVQIVFYVIQYDIQHRAVYCHY